MRPRWRSSGDGPAGLHPKGRSAAEDGGSRASWLARKAWHTPGKKVGEAVAGHRPVRRRPAIKRGRLGGLGTVFPRARRGSATPAADHARSRQSDPPQLPRRTLPEPYNVRRDLEAVSVRARRDAALTANDIERAAEIFGLVHRPRQSPASTVSEGNHDGEIQAQEAAERR